MAEPDGYRFGAFELDGRTGELRRKGLRVRLRGRPIEILRALLERRGELVSRDDLRARLWTADTFVDFDHGLNSAVNKLREALDDTAENPRFIETLPRRGYRWIGPAEPLPPAAGADRRRPPEPSAPAASTTPGPPPPPDADPAIAEVPSPPRPPQTSVVPIRPRRRLFGVWAAVLAGIVAVGAIVVWEGRQPEATAVPSETARRAMLVVLPFETVGGTPDQAFFGDGITEEMISQIGALDPAHLGVIARTTAM
jgi:DNA-binding winged helix-turn-helix (wHTH) protein